VEEGELEALKKEASGEFELVMMIHNVGTLGDISKWAKDVSDYSELNSYFSTNVFTPMILNNFFLRAFPDTKKFVVNITSKSAIAPFKSFAFYCAGKAAREMFFRVLAEESHDVLVLNYAPGPVETDMTVDAQANAVSEEISAV
jgi:sepiapterin reductase